MKKFISTTTLLGYCLMICGCTFLHEKKGIWFRDRSDDYLTSNVSAPLQTPDGIQNPVNTEQFPVPTLSSQTVLKPGIEPPGFGKDL